MAHVMETPRTAVESGSQEKDTSPAVKRLKADPPAVGEEAPVARRYFGMTAGPAVATAIVLLAMVGAIGLYFAWFGQGGTKSPAANTAQTASQATGSLAKPTSPQVQLSAAEIKEMKGRDDYATNLAKFLHAKLPAYKNVKIYADSWAGSKAPAKTPLADIKSRTGDNLMLVFWSPEAGTARGLAGFTKSPAALEAVSAGFAEFQFVDPDSYCFVQVVPVTGVGGVTCGIR
jgi:hypothetical protein